MPKIRLSHSSLGQLHECERKYQLDKLLAGATSKADSEHFSFGHCFGVGVATYLTTQDQDRALYEAWLAYWPEIENDKKNIPLAILALMRAFPVLDTMLMEYEVAIFKDRPAVELSFRLDINDMFYFVGHIDVVLKNKFSGKYFVIDAKSTGLALLDISPLYRYSGQTVGYSIAIDKIVGEQLAEFGVGYVAAQVNAAKMEAKVQFLSYEKTLVDRLKWFMTLGLDAERLARMIELNHFPMRSESCLKFNKPCFHFGSCHMHALDRPKELEEDTIDYDFSYSLDELIDDHLKRIPAAPEKAETILELT